MYLMVIIFNDMPSHVSIVDMIQWLQSNFGSSADGLWSWGAGVGSIIIHDDADCVACKLRFGV
jgi:hypothetical protein